MQPLLPASSRSLLAFRRGDRQADALAVCIKGLLTGHGQWQAPIAGTSVNPDAVWLEGLFAYMIIEIKNESGLGGDPFLQGSVLYNKLGDEKVPSPRVHPTLLRCLE